MSVLDAVKFAMGNNGNPLVLCHDGKREIAESLLKEFSAKATILFTREEVVAALDSAEDVGVIIWDGDSDFKDYLEKLFQKFPNSRKVCIAKTDFFNDINLYDTVIVG